MRAHETVSLTRDCQMIEIPSGVQRTLPRGTVVTIMQEAGSSYTVTTGHGLLFRVDAEDADALGIQPSSPARETPAPESSFREEMVWEQLRTIYDPEIPVNVVDLGLIYGCKIHALDEGKHRIDVKMTMTAPGCGMANVLKADVEKKLGKLPSVSAVSVEIVFDPPWTQARMSEAAKLQLGIDLDYAPSDPPFPILREPK